MGSPTVSIQNNNYDQICDISTHGLINYLSTDNKKMDTEKQKVSIGVKYGVEPEPEIDDNGLPILPDKSKYKAVAIEYCQKMGWRRPLETTQCVDSGYRAVVTFGETGKEKSDFGNGLRQKNAIYEAYIKLIPVLIPKEYAIELMIKWVPGYKKQAKVSMKHPKCILLEWAQKNLIAPPKTVFSEFFDSVTNMKIWTANVTFCGETVESTAGKKKDAESKCFQELLQHVMNDGAMKNTQSVSPVVVENNDTEKKKEQLNEQGR